MSFPVPSLRRILLIAGLAVLTGLAPAAAQAPDDALLQGFRNPPDSAKPRVWWHWMNGNISRDGIKADLEWMKRAGLGGFQNFDAGLETPQVVKKRLVFMTPEWKDAFRFTAALADELGLEMAIAGSPGWSESGGPWVKPAQAMKKYVWGETRIEGGRPFSGILPKPPSATGSYQNLGAGRPGAEAGPEFYADAAVVAFPAPAGDAPPAELKALITSSGGAFSLEALTDGDLAGTQALPDARPGEKAWLQLEFPHRQSVSGLTLFAGRESGRGDVAGAALEASADGRLFQTVAAFPAGAGTIAFPAVSARFFRVTIPAPEPPSGRPAESAGPASTRIAELVLHTSAVVNPFQDKAAFTGATSSADLATPAVPAAAAIRKADVIDLTARLRPDGRLDWTPPAGRWIVLRLGYSLTGHENGPASPEATGLEVDKMSRAHVKAYFDAYLDQYRDAAGPYMGRRGLGYVITDSWEAGFANWTDELPAEFARRRGYGMHPWLPVLAGRVVESAESSDRFLWDFRQTLGELTAEYHYDQLSDILKARGMGRYTESHEGGRAFIGDGMEVKRRADVPMSAMWVDRPGKAGTGHDADVRESASVAHIYGQHLVAAESLTAYRTAWMF